MTVGMTARIREVFTVRMKNNIKYTALILIVLILISVLSGCVLKDKPLSEQEAYEEYIKLIRGTAPKSQESYNLDGEVADEVLKGDYKSAKEKLEKSIAIDKDIYNDLLKAREIIFDDELKRYADLSAKEFESGIRYKKTMMNVIEFLSNDDMQNYNKSMDEAVRYRLEHDEWDKKRQELYLKLKKEGKL